jgi:hypothetical protein
MRVKMLPGKNYAGPLGTAAPGKLTPDLSAEECRELVAGGYAEDPAGALKGPPPADPVTAVGKLADEEGAKRASKAKAEAKAEGKGDEKKSAPAGKETATKGGAKETATGAGQPRRGLFGRPPRKEDGGKPAGDAGAAGDPAADKTATA